MMWHVAGMQQCRLMFYLLLLHLVLAFSPFRSFSHSYALKFVYWIFPDVFRGSSPKKETKLQSWAQECSVVSLLCKACCLPHSPSGHARKQQARRVVAACSLEAPPRFAWHSKFKHSPWPTKRELSRGEFGK